MFIFLIIKLIFGEAHKLLSCLLSNFTQPKLLIVTSLLLNILLGALLPDTLNYETEKLGILHTGCTAMQHTGYYLSRNLAGAAVSGMAHVLFHFFRLLSLIKRKLLAFISARLK